MAEPDLIAAVIRGPFSVAEWGEVVAVIRAIEARHLARVYEVCMVDAGLTSLEHAEALLRVVNPEVPGRVATYRRVPR